MNESNPQNRYARPPFDEKHQDIAPAFVFLASDEASYVNGEVLGVTGGLPLG